MTGSHILQITAGHGLSVKSWHGGNVNTAAAVEDDNYADASDDDDDCRFWPRRSRNSAWTWKLSA